MDGRERPHIKPIKALGEILRNNPKLSKAEFKPRIAFGIYEPYESLNLWNYNELDESTNLNEYLIGERGLLTLLVMSNAPFDVIDLELSSINELSHYEQLWVYSPDFMSREVQEKLVRYIENGGNLVILPMLPYLDENLEECRVLEEYLGVKVEKVKAETNPRLIPFVSVDAEGIDRMITRNKIRRIEGGEQIAFVDRKPVGVIVRKGKGSAVVLGFRLQYFPSYHDHHRKFVEYIMKLQRVGRDIEASNKDILTVLMEGSEYSYLVITNPRGHRIKGKIKVRDQEIPKLLDSIELKRRGVLFLPLNVKFENVEVVYATGTILSIKKDILTFYNHLSNKTEIALKGVNEVKVLNGKIISKIKKKDIILVAIEHKDDKVQIKLL
ncbi:hypothetical protein [Thermococcus sp.]